MKEDFKFYVFGWMKTKLHLSGNKLLVYAFIYHSTNQEPNYLEKVTIEVFSKLLGISSRTMYRTLSYLCEKGLIKRINSCHFTNYIINKEYGKSNH